MIVQEFDHGWGPEWQLKRWERTIVRDYLATWYHDQEPSIIINSTWYGQQEHAKVLDWLAVNPVKRIALVSMIDAAIPDPQWFADCDCEIRCLGYYPGPDEIDYWAVMVDQYMQAQPARPEHIDTAFLCYNRKPHWHRRQLFQNLQGAKLLDAGLVSMGSDHGTALRCIDDIAVPLDLAPNPGTQQHGISNDLFTLGNTANWHRAFLAVVTETVFDIQAHGFVSEKIFKPIMGHKPFLVYAQDGAKAWLTQHGFETFVEDFRDITDLDASQPENMVPLLAAIVQQGPRYWHKKTQDLLAKCEHNRENFRRYVTVTRQKIRDGI